LESSCRSISLQSFGPKREGLQANYLEKAANGPGAQCLSTPKKQILLKNREENNKQKHIFGLNIIMIYPPPLHLRKFSSIILLPTLSITGFWRISGLVNF
jgi:hypothetical protein